MSLSDWEDLVSEDEDDFETSKVSVNAPPAPWKKRLIILLDVDCFEVQLWAKVQCPEVVLQDVPVVVINPQKIILSVNYTARSLGVKRGEGHQALAEARSQCKKAGIKLVEIIADERHGKVDTFRPQTESDLIKDAIEDYIEMLRRNSNSPSIPIIVERNCKDEFYIDATQFIDDSNTAYYKNSDPLITPTLSQEPTLNLTRLKKHPNGKYNGTPVTIMEGRKGKITEQELNHRVLKVYPYGVAAHHEDERRLFQTAILANNITRHIKKSTGYEVSAGVGHSKLVAKLACGRNKPKGITIITEVSLPRLSKIITFQELPGYAGPTGQRIRDLLFSERKEDVKSINDLLRAINSDFKNLVPVFKKLNIPVWKSIQLQNLCQFKDDSAVIPRVYYDSFSTSLSFKGLTGQLDLFQNGVKNLSIDMLSRIDYYKNMGRHAKELCIKAEMIKDPQVSPGGCANKISISEDNFNAIDLQNKILIYIYKNNLDLHEILKIKLTASKIIVTTPCQNEEDERMSEGNFPIKAEQGRTDHKEFREVSDEPPVSYTLRTRKLGASMPTVEPLIAEPVKINFPGPKCPQSAGSAPDTVDEENSVVFKLTVDDCAALVLLLITVIIAIAFIVFLPVT